MAWIESHTVLIRHRKTISMALELKIKPVQLVGHLHALWHCVMEQAEDGDISKWENGFIASAACWEGDPDIFVNALKKNRWLDNGLLHDWLDYAGRYLDAKYRSSKPEILAQIRAKYKVSQPHNRHKSDFSQTKDGPPNLTNITKPSICSEDKDIPKDIIKEEAEPVKRKETAEAYIVRQFKIALGVPEMDKDWDKACFARNAKAAVAIIGAFQNDKVYATEWARKKIEHWQKWAKETGKSFSLERIAIEAQNDKGKYLEEKARIEKYQRQEGNNDKQHTTAKMGADYAVGQIKDSGLTQIGKAITPNINKPKER